MDRPGENTVEDILKNKLQAIKNIRYATPLNNNIVLGQYQGYREEKYIHPDSRTPTYLALKLFVADGPLKDVPIFIRTGKALEKKHARIIIQLKANRSPFNGQLLPGNKIIVTIQPDAWIMSFFNHKVPGLTMEVKEVGQYFFREDTFVEGPREGYQRLFSEIIRGNRLLAARCVLPLCTTSDGTRQVGTRHLAAMGLTEETDAVAVVVSEERGRVSLAVGAHRSATLSLDGDDADGVTVKMPYTLAHVIEPEVLEWLVPGLLEEKIRTLLRLLPKVIRKKLIPIPDGQ
jgi:hypothetical protein